MVLKGTYTNFHCLTERRLINKQYLRAITLTLLVSVTSWLVKNNIGAIIMTFHLLVTTKIHDLQMKLTMLVL